jgi:hypothetical protein
MQTPDSRGIGLLNAVEHYNIPKLVAGRVAILIARVCGENSRTQAALLEARRNLKRLEQEVDARTSATEKIGEAGQKFDLMTGS